MSSSSVDLNSRGGGRNNQAIVEEIMRVIKHQLPGVAAGAIVTAELVKQVKEVILKNSSKILGLLASGLMAGGLMVLLPSLAIAIVNAIGFTGGGVLAGSLAAAIQASVYGAYTGGVFSSLQAFGATATIAPPVALAFAGTALVVGTGYWVYQRKIKKQEAESHDSPASETDENAPSTTNNVVRHCRDRVQDFFNCKVTPKDKKADW